MTEREYKEIQDRLTAKLKNHTRYATNKETAYNEGILAAKSIIKSIYESKSQADNTQQRGTDNHGRR